jgi:hypothetical protein
MRMMVSISTLKKMHISLSMQKEKHGYIKSVTFQFLHNDIQKMRMCHQNFGNIFYNESNIEVSLNEIQSFRYLYCACTVSKKLS